MLTLRTLLRFAAIGITAASLLAIGVLPSHAEPSTATESNKGDAAANPLSAVFRQCDTDADGVLDEREYCLRGGHDLKWLQRDFRVFDQNRDGKIDLAEFLAVPVGQPEEQRGTFPDPIVLMCEKEVSKITRRWNEWDLNKDGSLNADEFAKSDVNNLVSGLEQTAFGDWDLNRDTKVSHDEIKQVLEIAFGVRAPGGEMHRSPSGRVTDWRAFRSLKQDANGYVSREVYFQALGGASETLKENWFKSIDQNSDGKFDYAEFCKGEQRTDPLLNFLQLDADLDGRLSVDELKKLPPDRFPVADYVFPGFDDDRDGFLSLEEFQRTPVINLLASWESARDTDGDGVLRVDEFRHFPGLALSALSAEYFKRLDINRDQLLSLDEFPFVTNHPPATEIYVQGADGSLTTIAIPGYSVVCSPEISPDNKWVAVDAWNQGQSNLSAHVLVASLETDEVRDFGIGCMPNWSADGRRLAFCKYSFGVFLRDFDGENEERVDPQGWTIQLSQDGLSAAYTKGANIVIYDLKTKAKRELFDRTKLPYRKIDHNIAWSADSRWISLRGHRANSSIDIAIVSATDELPEVRVRCDGANSLPDFAWHPNGKRLRFPLDLPGQICQIYEVDPHGDQPPIRVEGQPKHRHNGGLCWSRDGTLFAFVSTR